MSVKALKRQLIAAIAMVLVATIAMGSSTYAWFASNTKVEATGMNVTAMSDDAFLLISSTNTTATAIQTENKTTTDLAMTAADGKVYPAAHVTVANTTAASTVGNWFTGYSDDPSKVTMDESTKANLTSFDNYVIHKTLYMTVAKNSAAVKDIKVSAAVTAADGKTITQAKVLVTSATASTELSSATTSSATVLSNGNLTDASVLVVDVFIYIDGNDSAVYTNNFENLDQANVVLTFTGTAVPNN